MSPDDLRCPRCRGSLSEDEQCLRCPTCRVAYPIEDGIPVLIPARAIPSEIS